MKIGTVIGNVVSTRKNEALLGCKLMIVRIFEADTLCADVFNANDKNGSRKAMDTVGISAAENAPRSETIVAVDQIGAGEGDFVLVATGSAARVQCPGAPIDALIVGIIDNPPRL